jgi:hypothetical protein
MYGLPTMRSATMSVAPGTSRSSCSICRPMRSISFEVAAVDLHAHHGAEAGLEHDQAGLDRLEPRRQHAGDGGLLLEFGEDFVLGDAAFLGPDPRERRLEASRASRRTNARPACAPLVSGFRMMMLSIMPMGAGSSADSARPILPTTLSTSGTLAIARSCLLLTSMACESEAACGSSEGM